MLILRTTLLSLVLATLSVPMLAHAQDTQETDPYQGLNRKVHGLNEWLDKYFAKPVAKGYKAITPDPVETGVRNVFGNLGEITNIFNDLLQGKFGQAGNDTGRFLLNTTIGVAGIFDVAAKAGLEKSEGEDFGQTLGAWGVGEGAFVMLPLFGPSTMRDAPSKIIDTLTNPAHYIDDVSTRNTVSGVDLISQRAELLQAEDLISGDTYLLLRDVYLQRREYLVNDGAIEDDFGDLDEY